MVIALWWSVIYSIHQLRRYRIVIEKIADNTAQVQADDAIPANELVPPDQEDDDDGHPAPPPAPPQVPPAPPQVPPALQVEQPVPDLVNLDYLRNLPGINGIAIINGGFASANDCADNKLANFLMSREIAKADREIRETNNEGIINFYTKALDAIKEFSIEGMTERRVELARHLNIWSKQPSNVTEDVSLGEGERVLGDLAVSWMEAACSAITSHRIRDPLFWLLGGSLTWCANGCLISSCPISNRKSVIEIMTKHWKVGKKYHDSVWNLIIGVIIEQSDQQITVEVRSLIQLLASVSEIHVVGCLKDILTETTEEQCSVMFAFGWELKEHIEIIEFERVYAMLEEAKQTIDQDILDLLCSAKDEEYTTVVLRTETKVTFRTFRIELSTHAIFEKSCSYNVC